MRKKEQGGKERQTKCKTRKGLREDTAENTVSCDAVPVVAGHDCTEKVDHKAEKQAQHKNNICVERGRKQKCGDMRVFVIKMLWETNKEGRQL